MSARLLLALNASLAVLLVGCPAPSARPLSLLQANVGTALLSCSDHVFKLCDVAAEAAVAASIAAADHDVLVLQEILPDAVCDVIDAADGEDDPRRSCHSDARALAPTQLNRLLPPATWEVACDERNGFECTAVRRERGRLLTSYETAPPVADPALDCDPGFSVGRVDVALTEAGVADVIVRVVNGHPQSSNDACRRAQVEQLFGTLAVDGEGVAAVVVAGDMNLDPFSGGLFAEDASVPVWDEHVGEVGDDRPFAYASGPAERRPPYPTTTTVAPLTLDHVAVRGATGTCVTLGEAPGTVRLDGDSEVLDHRALDCALTVP